MSRMFEMKSDENGAEQTIIVDLDKICSVRVEKQPEQHYPRIQVRFVDGHEAHDIIPARVAHAFLEAYRAFLSGRGG
jgi:hypothetical protein